MAFKNAHQDMDGCTCLERNKKKEVRRQWDSGMLTGTWMDAPVQKKNKKMQVRRPWHSEMLTGTWMDAPGRKEIKKCRSISHGIRECSLGHGWMHLWKEIKKCRSVGHGIQECSLGHGWMYQAGKNKCRSISHAIGSCKYLSGMRFMYLLFQHHHPHIK